MEALEAIRTRRSTRKYLPDLPSKEALLQILDAGRHAPSGANSQTTHLLVITDKNVLLELAALAQQEFARMEIREDTYVSLKAAINASRKGIYVFHHNAPVLIVTANRKGYGNAMADSACALENMMIAANALDLGACWINQLHWLDDNENVRKYMAGLGLKEDETITGGLAVGFSDSGIPSRSPQEVKGNPVTWVGDL